MTFPCNHIWLQSVFAQHRSLVLSGHLSHLSSFSFISVFLNSSQFISVHLSSSHFIPIHKEGSLKNLKNSLLRLSTSAIANNVSIYEHQCHQNLFVTPTEALMKSWLWSNAAAHWLHFQLLSHLNCNSRLMFVCKLLPFVHNPQCESAWE